jgi:LPS-assembly lipoprotein
LTLACSVLMLSACGFQLRGQQDYAFKRLFVSGGSPAAAARLTRMVQGGSDTVVVTSPANADAILQLTQARGVATLTLSSLGVVQEYQLNLTMTYTLTGKDGTVLIPTSVIALNRAMTYSDQFSQAKAAESDILFADMENDAIDQLIRRLGVVHTLNPAPGQGVPAIAPRAPLPPPPL